MMGMASANNAHKNVGYINCISITLGPLFLAGPRLMFPINGSGNQDVSARPVKVRNLGWIGDGLQWAETVPGWMSSLNQEFVPDGGQNQYK